MKPSTLTRAERDLATARARLREADATLDAVWERRVAIELARALEGRRELAQHDPVTGRVVGDGIARAESAIRRDVAETRARMRGGGSER